MKFAKYFLAVVLIVFVLGCEDAQQVQQSPDIQSPVFPSVCLFTPQKIKFNQLTEFAQSGQITAYIDVFDQFDSRIKAVGVWQFELYESVPRSADSRGSRLFIWPNIELTEAVIHNTFWQEYLHCYKFDLNLDIDLDSGKTYILQAVCFTGDEKRITDTIELKP
jgi:hypothetical protein